MSVILETHDLCKKYKTQFALNNVSMTINKGDIYGFVGRNGAGKTTLIRLITGLANPTSGTFHLNVDGGLGKMGAVVEGPAIYLNLTGLENLKAQGILLGINDPLRFREVLDLVGLAVDEKKAKDYSLGMRQRLGIAMSLLSNPEFLILDEPANGLDPKGMIEMRELITRLNQEKGITILISSHILAELDKMATTYGFIENGRLLKEISANDVHQLANKKYTYVVSNTDNVKQLLYDKFGIADTLIIDDKTFESSVKIELSDLVRALDEINVKLDTIHEKATDLEKFFLDLIGGKNE